VWDIALTSMSHCGFALGGASMGDDCRSYAAGNIGLTFMKEFLNSNANGRTDVPGVLQNSVLSQS